ncbi:MAG: GNAT family N-acetyltransferase [Gemmataceae bacterium]|nr:GNAT family N-acetyltransferase [Gemmataceae bacterium]
MNLLATPAPVCSASPSPQMRLLTDMAELRRLVPTWQALLASNSQPALMCSPSWLLTWWDVYGRDRELCVGVFSDGPTVVGLALLCRRRHRYCPGLTFHRLEFLGSDVVEGDGVCSEYLNLVVRPGSEGRVAAAFASQLRAGGFGPWEECVLTAMDRDHPMTSALAEALHVSFGAAEKSEPGVAPYLSLPADWNTYLTSLPKKKRHSLKASIRDFEAWAGADWQLHMVETPQQRAEGMRILADLHRQRWKDAAGGGAFAAPRFCEFHERYSQLAQTEGLLVLLWMSVRGTPVAAWYGLRDRDRLCFYQSGRRLDVPAKVRLGIVMLVHVLQYAMAQGLREFDFLAGDAQYKQLFTHQHRSLVQLRVAPSSWKEWARRWLRRVRRFARES